MAKYACSDLHGRKDLFLKIKEYIQPEDIVYFLGDAGDRGPDGWELIKIILNDPQFIYLKGNHEDMLVQAVKEYQDYPNTIGRKYALLKRNGGEKTIEDWYKDGEDYEIINRIDRLPLHYEYTNKDGKLIILTHAGLTPWRDIDNSEEIDWPFSNNLLWDREHIWDRWDDADCISNAIVVHGHTPIQHIASELGDRRPKVSAGGYWYCENHKVGIDCQSAYSDIVCLLDLDTLEGITFASFD